ncbi:predicted protein [Plenodomus lingam JN3]|uniref:Predicted protein n=1 Tax=Leptosphaeria maculans (strain JN3 / isolate v23.1.3 / race Av1-4-5-6-7-8) TaxID=985895 RepID=E5AC58_LEPMJ|nr:predicted protein [Plenodomus lingam JN3]CBY00169.1 predicted protein [Plenodomus lingam JN3]
MRKNLLFVMAMVIANLDAGPFRILERNKVVVWGTRAGPQPLPIVVLGLSQPRRCQD